MSGVTEGVFECLAKLNGSVRLLRLQNRQRLDLDGGRSTCRCVVEEEVYCLCVSLGLPEGRLVLFITPRGRFLQMGLVGGWKAGPESEWRGEGGSRVLTLGRLARTALVSDDFIFFQIGLFKYYHANPSPPTSPFLPPPAPTPH